MTDPVSYAANDGIAVITVDNPPVNALGQAVRAGIDAAFARFAADGSARIAVILGAGKLFLGGADISEFGKPLAAPSLPEVINRIEAQTKPVVAAMQGAALGGGLEMALGAHYRIAAPGTQLGLPEVKLGIIPGAGGTQRTPRLIGLRAALGMIPAGASMTAAQARDMGLIDRLAEGTDPRAAGLAYARDLLTQGAPARPTGAMPRACDDPQALSEARSRWTAKARGEVAPLAAIDAIAASTRTDIAQGLAEERRLFAQLMDTPQRAGLIHAFFNDRRVAKLPEIKGITPRAIESIGVVGGGTMGTGIATAALLAGLPVTLVERDDTAAQAARDRLSQNLTAAVTRGKLTEAARDAALQANPIATDLTALSNADLIVEAVFEDMPTKCAVFAELDRIAKPGAILASNTSYLDINRIAAATTRPRDVIGLHFFSPAHVMKLIEVVVADQTAPDVNATAFALAKRLGKIPVRAGVCDGFIGNRILAHTRAAADAMVLHGASPFQIDAALTNFGFAMGPFAVSDLAGLDIGYAARHRRAATRDPEKVVPVWADALYHLGRLGRKTGRGYYLYDGNAPMPDPEVEGLIASAREDAGITPRTFSDDEITQRYMTALVAEAACVLADGIARRPLDIDVTLIHGYGFPRWRGGPMHWADTIGLAQVQRDLHRFAALNAPAWRPAPLLTRLADQGATFDSLNAESTP